MIEEDKCFLKRMEDRICELEAENKRLRSLLGELADGGEAHEDGGRSSLHAVYTRHLPDLPTDMVCVLDRKGVLVELIAAEQTHLGGFSVASLVGRNLRVLLAPELCRLVLVDIERVLHERNGFTSFHDISIGGQMRNYKNRMVPLDEEHVLCICRDITESENAKHELEKVKYALDNTVEEIYACDTEGTLEYANTRLREHYGLTDDLSRYKVYDLWAYQGSLPEFKQRVELIRRDKGVHSYVVHFIEEEVEVAWEISAYIFRNESTGREIVWFFGRNVTARYEQEKKIREMNSLLDCVLNNIPVYLFVKDPVDEFRYLYWNRAFEEYSHIPASKALGHTDYEIFPARSDAEKFRRDDLALLENGERIEFDEEYINEVGELRVVVTSKALVPLDDRPPLIIGISWDVTEKKRTERELIKARLRAEESDRLKSAFLANMSHEIRTPLNAIVGFSKLLASEPSNEERKQYSEIIEINSELLLQLINDILDISKIEAGTLEFNDRNFNLCELCYAQQQIHRLRTPPDVELVFEQQYDRADIVGDQHRLAQIFTNLITNALKFTSKGTIRFGFTLHDQWIECYVADTGTGIPPEKLEHIFDRFVKLNDFAVGTGLGLAITHMLVERMNGKIEVESKMGEGTCFRFAIPFRSPDNDVSMEQIEAGII